MVLSLVCPWQTKSVEKRTIPIKFIYFDRFKVVHGHCIAPRTAGPIGADSHLPKTATIASPLLRSGAAHQWLVQQKRIPAPSSELWTTTSSTRCRQHPCQVPCTPTATTVRSRSTSALGAAPAALKTGLPTCPRCRRCSISGQASKARRRRVPNHPRRMTLGTAAAALVAALVQQLA